MRILGQIGGNLRAVMEEEITDLSVALRSAVEQASSSLQDALRQQTRAAGLGAGLANAWRRETYPKGRNRTLHPAGLVYSKATLLHDAFDRGASILPRRSRYLVLALPAAVRLKLDRTGINRKGGSVPGGMARKYSDLDAAAARLGAEVVSARGGARSASSGGATGRRVGASTRRVGQDRPRILLLPSARRPGALVALYRPTREAKPVPLFLLLRATRLPRLLAIDAAAERAEDMLAAEVNVAIRALG